MRSAARRHSAHLHVIRSSEHVIGKNLQDQYHILVTTVYFPHLSTDPKGKDEQLCKLVTDRPGRWSNQSLWIRS